MEKHIFKAYDIRGVYPDEINEETAGEIARALAGHWKKGAIVVAHDARLSSPALYNAVVSNLRRSERHRLELVGMATTPMFYFLTHQLKAVGGIMITASHNPKNFNGMKIVGTKAEAVSGREIWNILNSTRNF